MSVGGHHHLNPLEGELMRYIVELRGIAVEDARAAMLVLRRHYGWGSVFRPDPEFGDGTYKLLGGNPYSDVPLKGTLEIKKTPKWPCALIVDMEIGIENPSEMAEILFLRTRDAFINQLPLSIADAIQDLHGLI